MCISLPSAHVAALRAISLGLKGIRAQWCITGSLGFVLHGMEMAVDDIDVQTSRDGAYEIEQALAGSVVERVRFSESERIRSHFGILIMHGVRIEIMGAVQKKLSDGRWEPPVDVARHIRHVTFQEMRLPVMDLAYEEQAYRTLGRTAKANQIREWRLRASP